MTSRKTFFFFLFNKARGLKIFVRLFLIKAGEGLEKRLAGAIYKEEKWRNGDKKSSWVKRTLFFKRVTPITMKYSP